MISEPVGPVVVNIRVAAAYGGAIGLGNVHETPDGNVAGQVNVTVPSYPAVGVSVMV